MVFRTTGWTASMYPNEDLDKIEEFTPIQSQSTVKDEATHKIDNLLYKKGPSEQAMVYSEECNMWLESIFWANVSLNSFEVLKENKIEEVAITAGKHYRLRNGYEFKCYSHSGNIYNKVHGAFRKNDNSWSVISLNQKGRYSSDFDHCYDIIEEWVNKPEVDWSLHAKWVKAISMQPNGEWWTYDSIPTKDKYCFFGKSGAYTAPIPLEYAPNWVGNWKDSLVIKP